MRSSKEAVAESISQIKPEVFWLDNFGPRVPNPPLATNLEVDCLIVGGGFSGLWTALHLKRREPTLEIALIEAGTIASGASGRNGGFVDASLTHGVENGIDRYPKDIELIERLGFENLLELAKDVHEEGIDCDLSFNGTLDVAVREWEIDALRQRAKLGERFGYEQQFLDQKATRLEVNSPTYLASLHTKDRCALVDPAKLAFGLFEAIVRRGVKVYEGTAATAVRDRGNEVEVSTSGSVIIRAKKLVLATCAFPSLLKGYGSLILPVYDYVLVSEPLDERQLAEIRWHNRQGLADSGNLFHYYRMTKDNRILFGGYDAIYHFANSVDPAYNFRKKSFETLATHFFETFPSLQGLHFTHGWGGPIDTSSRFSMFFGSRYGAKVFYVGGFTGLGVGATRFAGKVLADKVLGEDTTLTRLPFVTHKPLPFPPEPFRSFFVWLTRRSLISADGHDGRRNLWLKLLDAMHIGFDS